PSSWPSLRANAISARLAPFSMISTESRMISGLRRTSTPSAPVTNRRPASTRYQPTSGPCIVLQGPRMRAEDDPAHRRYEQDDRRHLEREEVVGQEEAPDRCRRPELPVDARLVRQAAAGGERERH